VSYFSVVTAAALVFPALSVHVAPTAADALSGPAYTGAVQEATPDTGSFPIATTRTGRLYQPLPSGTRSGATATAGADASYLNVETPGGLALPATSMQPPPIDAVAEFGPA
jgi:hypothetical protein